MAGLILKRRELTRPEISVSAQARSIGVDRARIICDADPHVFEDTTLADFDLMTQNIEASLAPHPHQMELWGDVTGVSFPPLCANCGNPAQQRLKYKKEFVRMSDSDTPNTRVSVVVSVPFCAPCMEKHKAEGPGPSLLANILSRLLSLAQLLGMLAFGAAAGVAGYYALRNLGQKDLKFFYGLTGVAGFLLLPALGLLLALLEGTEIIRIERQNSITRAFDFGDSTAAPFRTPTFVCTMRSDSFASAFRELNQSLAYDPAGPAVALDAVRAKRKFWIALVFFGGLALLAQLFLQGKA
jgi:hypothetical protein